MPEPVTAALALASPLVKPALEGLSHVILALKEPMGKRKVEQMRTELLDAMEGLRTTIAHLEEDLTRTDEQLKLLADNVAYMRLPFWIRWRTDAPAKPDTHFRSLGGVGGRDI